MNHRTTTRRRALQLGSIGAIAAGLLGSASTAVAAPAVASPLVVGTVTNVADIAAEVDQRIKEVRVADAAVSAAQEALLATFTVEQKRLFMDYEAADNIRDFDQMDLYIAELGRHLPGLQLAIWALWLHIIESRQGCCAAGPDDE